MNETRYAILIGQSNYNDGKHEPLKYAVKDANDLAQALVDYCRFKEDNIYLITDNNEPVTAQINNTFEKIKKTFRPKEDLLFFYFSGHGRYNANEAKSVVVFENGSTMQVYDIFEQYFTTPEPKNSFLIIDACQSGSPVRTKGLTTEKQIRVLNHNAKSLYLMFATETKLSAYEEEKLENSYFTYYFLEAIKSERLYDEDGLLTIQVIDNHVKKYVSQKSQYFQIPVSESLTTGYKPFAFLKSKMKSEQENLKPARPSATAQPDGVAASNPELHSEAEQKPKIGFEESLNWDHRASIQSEIFELAEKVMNELVGSLKEKQLEFSLTNGFSDLQNSRVVEEAIISKARSEQVMAVNDYFEITSAQRKPYNMRGGISTMLDFFNQRSEPDVTYKIYSNDRIVLIKTLLIKKGSVQHVRAGLVFLVYQSNFGFAVASAHFHYDWNATTDDTIRVSQTQIKPQLLNDYDADKLYKFFETNGQLFLKKYDSLNQKRSTDIASYVDLVKKANAEK